MMTIVKCKQYKKYGVETIKCKDNKDGICQKKELILDDEAQCAVGY